jgi:hypothetical protein
MILCNMAYIRMKNSKKVLDPSPASALLCDFAANVGCPPGIVALKTKAKSND